MSLEFANSILGAQSGVVLLLFVCLAIVLVAYWQEKKKNDRTADARLKEAREDTELLVDTVNEAVSTVREFKASNDALRFAFETLTSAVRERQIVVQTTPNGPADGG